MINTLSSIKDLRPQFNDVFNYLDVSETTKNDYKARIPLFIDHISKEGFTRNSFLVYKQYLRGRNDFTVSTKNKYLATAKVFLKELNRLGTIPVDLTQNIKSFPQIKKHKKQGLSEDEVKKIWITASNLPSTSKNDRLVATLALLIFQGLRQIEIIRLDTEDLNLNNGTAFVQSKGAIDKELIHLHPETIKALKCHIKSNKVGSGSLFRALGNRKSERITTMTIKRMVKELFEILGIDNSAHGFRHYYVTTLLKHMEVRDVRKFSRHRSLEMLIVYDDEIDIASKSKEVFNCFNFS